MNARPPSIQMAMWSRTRARALRPLRTVDQSADRRKASLRHRLTERTVKVQRRKRPRRMVNRCRDDDQMHDANPIDETQLPESRRRKSPCRSEFTTHFALSHSPNAPRTPQRPVRTATWCSTLSNITRTNSRPIGPAASASPVRACSDDRKQDGPPGVATANLVHGFLWPGSSMKTRRYWTN